MAFDTACGDGLTSTGRLRRTSDPARRGRHTPRSFPTHALHGPKGRTGIPCVDPTTASVRVRGRAVIGSASARIHPNQH